MRQLPSEPQRTFIEMKSTPPNLRKLLAHAMQARGLSQTTLARASGVAQPNISDFLAGKSTVTVETAERLLHAAGCVQVSEGEGWVVRG